MNANNPEAWRQGEPGIRAVVEPFSREGCQSFHNGTNASHSAIRQPLTPDALHCQHLALCLSISVVASEIKTNLVLDAETESSYWLSVTCEDQGVIPLHANLQVYVEVEDVNDETPLTVLPFYSGFVVENREIIADVVQLKAWDADLTATQIFYEISAGDPDGHFTINQTSGLIRSSGKKVDREERNEFLLEVTVRDSGVPILSSVTKVLIVVTDINDHPPVFDQAVYHITVPELFLPPSLMSQNDQSAEDAFALEEIDGVWESFPPNFDDGVEIFTMLAHDKDEGENGRITYSLKGGNLRGKFFINAKTGAVYTQRSLLRGHQYNVMVMASDGGKPSRNATARVSIKVKGVPSSSRHSPVIKNPNQSVQILESDMAGYMVAIIHASDLDDDTLYFNITDGNNERRFMVTRDKGTVYLAGHCDAEISQHYNLTISVTDGVHTAYTQLFITVLDINEFYPAFSKYQYDISVPESAETGSIIFNLNATDKDVDKKLVYKIHNAKNPESLQLFTLRHNTGEVTIANSLDRENLVSHTITIVVHDSGTPTKKNFTRLVINVQDVNDHMPQFNVESLEPKIYHTSLIGTRIVTLMASDHDLMENGTVTYSIVSGNDGGKFTIDHVLGHLCLAKTIGPSDPLEYSLVIQASDSGVKPLRNTLPVHISVISAADVITKFTDTEVSAEVYENSPIGTFVTQLEAYGSGLLFEIINGNQESSFTINPTIGAITVNDWLDRERTDLYNLTIAAFSLFGGRSTCYVTIYILDANDNPPKFVNNQLEAYVLESADVGSFILDKEGKPLVPKAVDCDLHTNSMFTYQFFTKNLSSMFHIDPNTGTVRTVVRLDYETTPSIVITVIATDKGVPKLTSETVATINLTVINTNDSPPVFTQSSYNATVLLPTFVDVTVTQVTAVDADLEKLHHGLTYVISEGNDNGIYEIDEKDGLIRIKDRSKLSGPSLHKLKVTASDGKYTTKTTVSIKCVQNLDDKGLSFERKIYLGAVLENSTQSITVAVVSVRGALLNDHVIFSILNPQPQFTIGSVSGAVKTTGTPLDREAREFYSFVVQAERLRDNSDESPEWHIARTLVNVTVLDINDNCPIVINKELHAVISQSVRKHQFVTRVMAHDLDKEENGDVHFELQNHYDIFKICPRSGNITIKQPVPNLIREYKLIVAVRDNGIPPCTTKGIVHVSVLDEDTPIFEQQLYQAYVPEDITGHTPIPLTLRTFSPLTNDIIYTIVDGDNDDEFQTVFSSGSATGTSPCVIRVNGALDYESTDTYSLKIRAIDAVTGKSSETMVEILVQDVNDNAPEFLQDIYNVSVLETLNIGGFVGQVYAIDRDVGLNGAVRYAIDTARSEEHSHFYIKSSTGEVFLKKSLDYEVQSFFSLWIKAFDTGTPSKSTYTKLWIHVIDVVDTGPVVVEPIVGLIYGTYATRGQFVAAIRSYHSVAGVKLAYSLLSHETIFTLDKDSGILTVANTGNISCNEAKVEFSVTDGVYTTPSSILIRVQKANQMSPKFENYVYEITIKENIPKDAHVVTLQATDGDMGQGGHLEYSIVSEAAQKTFRIDPASGEITTLKLLDREAENHFEFLVQAADPGRRSGLTTVMVTLLDVNDNTPTFIVPKYTITVSTKTIHNATIVQVEAVDLDDGFNGAITYSIIGNGNIENLFSIDSISGNLTLKSQSVLLRDNVYQFFVRAKDGGSPPLSSEVPVTVYVSSTGEKIPLPAELPNTFFISESSEKGSVITVLENAFEGRMSYKVFGPTRSIISVSKSGKVTLAKTLDREEVAVHKLAILMEISTNPPISSVAHLRIHVLDVNDNKPKFEQAEYHVLITEGIPEGEKLLKVKANDLDEGKNAELHYWLEDNLGILSIDRRTGWITTHAELDREERSEYVLNVVAFDNGTPALSDKSSIHIKLLDANDNPPVFAQASWNISISEDSPIGTFLIQLETNDADEKSENLEFYIISGDKDCKFSLNNQGNIFLMRSLDREETSQYFLVVTATDGKFAAETSIFIRVLDINDEKPQCLKESYFVQLSEDSPLFTYVTSVEAFDPDSEPNYYFFLNAGDDKYFSINNVTGEIRTKGLLDREQVSQHILVTNVADKDNSTWKCQSTVYIKLVDVNDCPPKFDMDNMTAMVVENTPIGSVVTMVHAADPDLASSAKVKYSLLDSIKGKFKIDSKSGLIQLMGTVDREERDSYNLVVRASDKMAPELYSDARLTVTVLDVNDNPPIFSQKVYHSQVSESAPIQSRFMKLEAYSADIGANAEILYLIINGNTNNQFSLDLNTGILSVANPLDYESTKNYMLTVEARDLGEPPLSTQALVNISVIDSNDNTPIFLQTLYTTVVPEDANVGSSIIQVIASDADSGENGRLTYSIKSGDAHNQFSINPNDGYVNVVAHLDREKKDSYTLVIRATDGGVPPLSTTACIVIEVSDINDNPPRFSSSNYSAFIQEGKKAEWAIIKLEVHDADLAQNGGPFEFDIQSGNEKNLFSIGADGVIKTNAVVSGHLHKSYDLHVRVYDSGTPPLYSDTVVTITVTEESQHPPLVSPLNVVVMSYANQLQPKRFLGTVHVSDSDPYDSHAFKIETTEPNKFHVEPMSGRLSMTGPSAGVYSLNVTVTDGKFTSKAFISVVVHSVFKNMLLSALSLRFRGMSPKYFLVNGRKTILRMLKKLLKTDILLLSIQPANHDLDVLLSFQEYISIEELNNVITESRLAAAPFKCNCQNGGKCKQNVTIIPHRVLTTYTETESFVAPEHTHFLFCSCSPAYRGEYCEEEACECPPPTLCSHQGGAMVCTSPPPVAPLCSDNRTCDSPNAREYTFVYPYIVILLITAVLLSAAAAISVILWRRSKDRNRSVERPKDKAVMFRVDSLTSNKKISNIKASKGLRPSPLNNGNEVQLNSLPLNNLENSRNCSLEESSSFSCSYLQNIDPTKKITNGGYQDF
ncbi:Laminin G domain [Nesidiocoris tenuis]|uniref:Laminin G domain n=2 Tax=Nesidiocoris tenuis TaxID=355587 RepID=A0ABN7AFV5_9HEMI|nr:Laminin G domain [Nesidiocoris tenuis]